MQREVWSVEQLRVKYKWFKREWKPDRRKSSMELHGISSEDTSVPDWYDYLNPIFSEAVDDMTDVACCASDVSVFRENDSDGSNTDGEGITESSVSQKLMIH